MKLSVKLLRVIISGTMAVILMVSLLTYTFTKKALKQAISNNQLELARQTMKQIDALLHERYINIQAIAGEIAFQDGLLNSDKILASTYLGRIKDLTLVTGPWNKLFAVDVTGKILVASDESMIGKNISEESHRNEGFKQALQGTTYHSDWMQFEDTGKYAILFAAPVRNQSDPKQPIVGVVMGGFSWPAVEEILEELSVSALLMNHQGNVIATNIENKFGLLHKNLLDKFFIQEALKGTDKSMTLSQTESLTGQASLVSFVPQQGRLSYLPNGWSLILTTPVEQALASASNSAFNLVLLLIPIVIFIVFGFSFLLSKYIVKPILLLTKTIKGIDKRDLSIQAPVLSNDEIGELATTFNQMIQNLMQTTISRDYLETTLDSIGDAVIATDMNKNITFMNPAAKQLTGWNFNEAKNRNIDEIFFIVHATTHQKAESPVAKVIHQGLIRNLANHTLLINRNKNEIPIDILASPIRDQSNHMIGVILVFRDVSERYHAEKEKENLEIQLRSAQKLEAIGQLSAGVAHEINTPTQYVGDNTRFLQDSFASVLDITNQTKALASAVKDKLPSANEIAENIMENFSTTDMDYLSQEIPNAITQSLEGIERISEIVRAMKEFAHPGVQTKTPINLNHALQTTITVARNEWKYVAEMKTDFDSNLPMVTCHPGEINQVFLNLIVNAAHAIADKTLNKDTKGEISIQTKQQDDFAEIRISDNGNGIPESIKNRIFDPFFTTKEIGKGTGQGLAIAHAVIVNKHAGSIHFESSLGVGTTFIIKLPLNQELA